MTTPPLLLVLAVVAVGVLHTLVPDHWAPIAILARQQGWSRTRTARTAAVAGLGHAVSTLILAAVLWIAGAALATRFGSAMSTLSSIALIAFGAWIAIASWRDIVHQRQDHGHSHFGHTHVHRHAGGIEHRHWHDHHDHDVHPIEETPVQAALHEHEHKTSARTALLLILGSSPMVEGIPVFFAAGRYGAPLLGILALAFGASTILTYVLLCTASARGLERLDLGRFEQYGEVISGSFIALLGLIFLIFPSL